MKKKKYGLYRKSSNIQHGGEYTVINQEKHFIWAELIKESDNYQELLELQKEFNKAKQNAPKELDLFTH
jgi:hypothetical protein